MKKDIEKIVKQAAREIQQHTEGSIVIAVNYPNKQTTICQSSNMYSDQMIQIILAFVNQLSDEIKELVIKMIMESMKPTGN